MPKSLSVATVVEKNKIASTTAFVVLLDIAVISPVNGTLIETLRVALNNESVTYQGNTYVPTSFDLELNEEAGGQTTVTLSMVDYSQAIQARMQQYGGGVGFGVTVTVVNTGNLTQPPEVQEFFTVVGASSEEYVVSFELGAENALALPFPRRRQTRDFCQWRYKDPNTCGYTGAIPTCDLSLQGTNGCAAHNNSANFGAFPGISYALRRYA